MELKGKLHTKGETKTFGESFNKREFVLFVENERNSDWSDYIKLELIKDKCSLIDSINIGDELNCSINLKGRLWTNPKGEEVCFNTIDCWRLEKISYGNHPQAIPTNSMYEYDNNGGIERDLPF